MRTSYKIFWIGIFLFAVLCGVFAGGNKEVPEIPPVSSGVQYLSPNGDDIQEEATLTFTVKLFVKSESGYVPEYGLQILSPSGEVVAQEITTEDRDIGWLASIFKGYDQFELEKSITWDGRDDEGSPVDDGIYTVEVWVKDANDNETRINVDDFVVDTKAPAVTLGVPESLLFAPNGDGVADTFPLTFRDGTEEDLWTLAFLDEENAVVRSITWEDSAPADFAWDGSGEDGSQVTDGTYSLKLTSEDRGGNGFSQELAGIILDSRAPVVRQTVENAFFSPNEDGILDEAVILFEYDDTDTASWSWSLSRAGSVVRQVKGEGAPPERIAVDGLDDQGLLPQGDYNFAYSVTYENGWRPVIQEPLELDVSPQDKGFRFQPHLLPQRRRAQRSDQRYLQVQRRGDLAGQSSGHGGKPRRRDRFGSNHLSLRVGWDRCPGRSR